MQSEEKWKRYEEQYDAAWHAGLVQYRRGSDHDVTPTLDEMPDEPGSIGSQLNRQEQEELSSRVIPAGSDEVTMQSSAMSIRPRRANFESRLRQDLRDITESCATRLALLLTAPRKASKTNAKRFSYVDTLFGTGAANIATPFILPR